MAFNLRPAVAGLFLAATAFGVSPALADVFSSQGFTGDTTTIEQLPGVNLDVVPGFSNGTSNCVEENTMAFSGGSNMPQKATTCRMGNFSITTTGSGAPTSGYDTTYGGNPPPWVPRWRP